VKRPPHVEILYKRVPMIAAESTLKADLSVSKMYSSKEKNKTKKLLVKASKNLGLKSLNEGQMVVVRVVGLTEVNARVVAYGPTLG
jgi:hypothetical protein